MVDFNEGNLNPIIEKSFKIAVHYLHSKYQRVFKLLKLNDLSYEDLAIDSIAELFSKSSNSEMPIITSFKNWHPQIKTEEEFTFFLNKIVSNRVEQHIIKLLKEADPLFESILTSINYLIRKNKYSKSKYIGTVYIIESEAEKITGKIIPQDDFDIIPVSNFLDDKEVLKRLFQFIKNETNFFPAIPLNALVLRIKEIKSSCKKFFDAAESHSNTFELNELLNKGLLCVKSKLEDSYIKKGKLSKSEAEKLFLALKDMNEDLKTGGINPGLYEYLKDHINDLTTEVYREKYHNILEYLLKVMKNNIIQELDK